MMDKDYLYQIDIREWIERGLDADIMVPVSGNKIDKKYDIYLQSFLLPLNEVENDMENDTYNAHTLMPGITVYGSWEDDEKVYHRWGNDNGYEPLVIKREYNGVATDSIEIVEEFRLLFNLYFNSQKNEYIDVSNGEGITVVKMNDNGYVTIHKRYLKTYLAVKEKVLMIHIDSRCVSIDNSEKIKEDGLVYRNSENTIFYALNIGNTSTGLKRKNYSIIYAKNVVSGCSLCDSNIWPYNEEKTYVDFIIGIDENGKEIRHTCNPKELNNYFGANPTAPHYLTPVYFDSAVLNKYYSKPEIYKVEDGIIRCGVLWSLYIDNSNSDYVSAYDFIDDPNHSMRSEIQLFDFQDSPEHILLHLSEKAQIIGISATATLETVVGNYDLEYLQRMLQDKYYVMPEADRCRLQESFQTFVANYDKVNIHVEPVSYNADDRVELSEIFNGNEALIKKYAEKLSISFERVEYAKNNFIRVVKVMKAFILNDSVKSFLCLNNKLPQENKGLFDIKLLEEFADAIIKLYDAH